MCNEKFFYNPDAQSVQSKTPITDRSSGVFKGTETSLVLSSVHFSLRSLSLIAHAKPLRLFVCPSLAVPVMERHISKRMGRTLTLMFFSGQKGLTILYLGMKLSGVNSLKKQKRRLYSNYAWVILTWKEQRDTSAHRL